MTVNVSKPAINVREKLAELDKPTGIAGEAMLRAETPQEQFNLIGAGRRNLIMNGAMQVAQRGTSTTGVNSSGYYAVDRFRVRHDTSSTSTIEQSSDAPDGFNNSLKLTTTSAGSIGSTENLRFDTKIESRDLQQLKFGTSSAAAFTISFWVKSSIAGNYSLNVYQYDGAKQVNDTYTINTANTWEYKSITFVGNTGNVNANDSTAGFEVAWFLASGSSVGTGSQLTSWTSYTIANYGVGQAVDISGTLNATWQITGVQLELGKVATPFEHRSYGEELALCQRYYQKIDVPDTNGLLGTTRTNTSSGINEYIGTEKFMVTMRANPTASQSGVDRLHLPGVSYSTLTQSPSFYVSNNTHVRYQALPTTNNTAVIFAWLGSNSGGYIAFDAEL